jgi:nitroreductase
MSQTTTAPHEWVEEVLRHREPTHEISPLILERWSPRAMTGEPLADEELMPLFEAARWAPSSFNNQPWRFLYAKRDTKHWGAFLALLVEKNREWAQKAAALVVILSRKNFEHNGKPSRTHAFDAGAAWENLALEGARRGLVVHGMEGFDYEKARSTLHVPDDVELMAMAAIGRRGRREELPERARAAEQPNGRKPLVDLIHEGAL